MSMRPFLLGLRLLLYTYLGYVFVFLLTSYDPAGGGYHPPFMIFVIDTINLFIHEAGHFFLKPFGMWIYVFGGSFVQIFLPAMLLLVTWRQAPAQAPLPAFWTGESMVNVSVYIKDAPFRELKLLARGVIHDWNWLLADDLDMAEPLGATVYWLGIILCVTAVGAGMYFAVRLYREDAVVLAK